jgi:hypothetical protein
MLISPSELRHVTKAANDGPYLVADADAVSLSYPSHGNDACNAIEGFHSGFDTEIRVSPTLLGDDFKPASSSMWAVAMVQQQSHWSQQALTVGSLNQIRLDVEMRRIEGFKPSSLPT